MKAFLLTVAILALLFGLGWLSYTSGDGSASVTIDTDKVKEDTSAAVEKGKELVEDGVDKLKSKAEDEPDPSKDPEDSQLQPATSSNP